MEYVSSIPEKAPKMKNLLVETLTFHAKITFDRDHTASSSHAEIQEKLDEYSNKGYRLISTDAVSYGGDLLVYLYFEKV